ncbi:MAG: beta-N-acetylhexosaminidase, partial [Nitrospinales bacterium]
MKKTLTLPEKAGQMLIAGFEGTKINSQIEDLILKHHVGGFILFERNYENPEQLFHLIQDMQKLAFSKPSRLPLFISVDQEGGRVARLSAPFSSFPFPCCLGAAKSEDLAFKFGQAMGQELAAVGINIDYAPVLDVNTNPHNPIIGNRAFSDDPKWAARLGADFIRGCREAGVLPVGKHFPGHGDTRVDSHLELPYVDRDAKTLEKVELHPFAQAIKNGVDILMTAHVVYRAWDDQFPATFSAKILQDILRKKLGYRGLIISDDLEMKAVENHFSFESFPQLGVSAGIDLF